MIARLFSTALPLLTTAQTSRCGVTEVPPRPGELPKNLPPPKAFGLPPEAAHGLRPEMLGYPSADGKTPAPSGGRRCLALAL